MFEVQKGEHKDKDKELVESIKHFIVKIVNVFLILNSRTNCTDGYLKLFLKGQETQDAYDKFDYELCGMELPHPVVSDGPRLAMVFSSGELLARGFKVRILKIYIFVMKYIIIMLIIQAKYTFETEYKIPGTAAPDGSCSFTYRSTSRKKGEFNSPRFPSKYISGMNRIEFFKLNYFRFVSC